MKTFFLRKKVFIFECKIAATHALGVLGMMLSLGIAVGDNLNILFRRSRLRRPPIFVPEAAPRAAVPFDIPEAQTHGVAQRRPTTLPKQKQRRETKSHAAVFISPSFSTRALKFPAREKTKNPLYAYA